MSGYNKRIFIAERNYWKKFYTQFTDFLYNSKNCYDNYVGTVIKVIRIFFNFLNKDMSIQTGEFYKTFYVRREEVPIVTLLPEQLQFLICNADFENKLSKSLQKTKDVFVFGCTVALRVSDLFAIKFNDIEKVGSFYYLPVKTIKTGTVVRIKLPDYAIAIIEKFKYAAKGRKTSTSARVSTSRSLQNLLHKKSSIKFIRTSSDVKSECRFNIGKMRRQCSSIVF
jgi:integrase